MTRLELTDPAYRTTVDALLASDKEVFAGVDRRLRGELSVYERVGAEAIRRSVQLNLALTVHVLRTEGGSVPREIMDRLDAIIGERIQAGITTEQMIQGHNIVMGAILARFIELGEQRQVSAEVVLASSQLLWRASHVVLQRSTSLMQQRMVEIAMREQSHRDGFVRALVAGRLAGSALEAEALVYRLDPELPYVGLRARPRRPADAEGLCRSLQDHYTRGGERAVVTVLGRDCVGVVSAASRASAGAAPDASVAVGPPVRLADISASFAVAGRILAWMLRRAEHGTKGPADLSWRLLVDDDRDLNARLRARYLDPLAQEPTLGALIEESLRAHLAHDRNVARAADHLVVHPNTLRYRLRRYAELTGVDLDSTEDLVGLAWALEAARAVVPTDNDEV
mgnify:CR=1 FL=1